MKFGLPSIHYFNESDLLDEINKEARELYLGSLNDGHHRSGIWKHNLRSLKSHMNSKGSPIDKISKILNNHHFSSGTGTGIKKLFDEIMWSIEYTKNIYGVDVRKNGSLRESNFWRSDKIVTVEGDDIYRKGRFSSDFFRHLFCFLEIQKYCKCVNPIMNRGLYLDKDFESKIKIVELGSGIGNLARIFKIMRPKTQYFFIDIPESLYYGFMFMRLNFPDCSYKVVLDEEISSFEGFDFVFVPTKYTKVLYNQYFDLIINECSLGEMIQSSIEYWFDFIQNKIDVKYFYSFNRVHGSQHSDSKGLGDSLVGYDEKWKTLLFDTNPSFNRIPNHPRGEYLTGTQNYEKIVERS